MNSYTKKTFGELNRGDRFSLSPLEATVYGPALNMKVDPAQLCHGEGTDIPFNVVCLGDGRVRTFRDDEPVWLLEGEV